MLPSDDSIEWTDSAHTMHLVERIVPDALAGKPVSDFHSGENVRLVGLIRAGLGRVNVEGLFAQEDDILEFLVTNEGLRELPDLLKAGAQ
jgi:hypothetical protein